MTTAESAHWLPRAGGGLRRGELLRRSFEDRLEQRDPEEARGPAPTLTERIERFRAAELERQAAAADLLGLPAETRTLLATVLALPPDAQAALARLL